MISPELNASREQVVHAFRAPEHFAQWWGSKDFRNTIHSFDFMPGERLELTLRGLDGDDYENEYVVEEIAERQRIVFSHPDSAHSVHLGAAARAASCPGCGSIVRRILATRD